MIAEGPMTKRRNKDIADRNGPKPGNTSTDRQARAGFTSEPLRREAERGWEESDRTAAEGIRRRKNKARAHKLRRQTAREKDELIARLEKKVARLEEELAKHLKPRRHD